VEQGRAAGLTGAGTAGDNDVRRAGMDSEEDLLQVVQRAESAGASAPLARALDQLAGYYHSERRYQEAASAYRRSVALWRDILGPAHPSVATLLVGLGQIYLQLGHLDEAEPLFRQALTIIESSKAPGNTSVVEVFEASIQRLRTSGRQAEADSLELRVRRVVQLAAVAVKA
jgi:tetratricopeptide (TPR) repeat protein